MSTLNSLPLVQLREPVLFPGAMLPITVRSAGDLEAVAEHLEAELPLVVAPGVGPGVAVAARVLRSVELPDGGARLLLEGLERVQVLAVEGDPRNGYRARVEALPRVDRGGPRVEAAEILLRGLLKRLLGEDTRWSPELGRTAEAAEGPERLADWAPGILELPPALQRQLLEQPDLAARLERIAEEVAKALELSVLAARVQTRAEAAMDRRRREQFLRDQLAALQAELGEGASDSARLRARLTGAGMPDAVLNEALASLERLRGMEASEASNTRAWLETLAGLPWSASTVDDNDLRNARRLLDTWHEGLAEAKDRILEYLAVRQLNPAARGLVLCFVGPPGVGKTSLAQAIAEALGRSFQRVALGGVRDEAEIRGHRRTYVGAMPGRIVQALRRAGTRNPVLLLDELDKLGQDRGDPAAALLEVLDPSQNLGFVDHYVDAPFDLSQVLFLATANLADGIPEALRDRLEIVHLSGYTEEEKLRIARKHLLPRARAEHAVDPAIGVPTLRALLRGWTREAGVRQLEREIARLHRKAARRLVEGRRQRLRFKPEDLPALLGPPPFRSPAAEALDRPGVAVGLAWTPAGGELLVIEAARFPGTGQLKLTGSVGAVMRESLDAAWTLLRGRAAGLGIPDSAFTTFDVHVHVPDAGIPKDGPSAGLAMLLALASLALDRPLRPFAVTGEITLRGRILPVGGLREKVLAAKAAGLPAMVPRLNLQDLAEADGVQGVEEVAAALALALPVDNPPGSA